MTTKRTSSRFKPYTHMVEGEESGVPFRVFFKYKRRAEVVAGETRGIMTDLATLRRTRLINDKWEEA